MEFMADEDQIEEQMGGMEIHVGSGPDDDVDELTELPADLPVLRSYCDGTYFKEDAGKLLFGFAHFHAKPWATAGIPEDFCFDSLPFIEDDVMVAAGSLVPPGKPGGPRRAAGDRPGECPSGGTQGRLR